MAELLCQVDKIVIEGKFSEVEDASFVLNNAQNYDIIVTAAWTGKGDIIRGSCPAEVHFTASVRAAAAWRFLRAFLKIISASTLLSTPNNGRTPSPFSLRKRKSFLVS
jgi:hypothetical protein